MLRRSTVALVAVATLMAGCLVPEKFAAKAEFQSDGSYAFTYQGSVVHGMAAMQLAQTGKLSPSDNNSLAREVSVMKRNPDVRSVSYRGNGRYDLTLEAKRSKGQSLDLLGIANVRTGKDAVITISAPEISAKGKKELAQLGIKVEGTLDVTLPRNAEVIEHNATGTPRLFGLVGTYSWKLGSVDQRPMMKFRLKG